MCKTSKCTQSNVPSRYGIPLSVCERSAEASPPGIWRYRHLDAVFITPDDLLKRRMVSAGKENDHIDLEWSKAMETAFAVVENPGIHLTVPDVDTRALRACGLVEPADPSGRGQTHPVVRSRNRAVSPA